MTPVEDGGLGKTLLDWAWAGVLALLGILWKKNQKELDEKADKEVVDRHHNLFEKLFDRIDEHAKDDQEFHKKIMEQTHVFHTSILDRLTQLQKDTYSELTKKADRKGK